MVFFYWIGGKKRQYAIDNELNCTLFGIIVTGCRQQEGNYEIARCRLQNKNI